MDLEGFLWFLQKLSFETRKTLQDKFALKLCKPTNLYASIEVNSYLETLEICKTAQVHFILLDTVILYIATYMHA